MNKIFTFHRILATAGLTLWLIETGYFGWNPKPINGMERMFDTISQVMLWWGIIGDITSNITIKKDNSTTIRTNEVVLRTKDEE